jgi:hypothetical protein
MVVIGLIPRQPESVRRDKHRQRRPTPASNASMRALRANADGQSGPSPIHPSRWAAARKLVGKVSSLRRVVGCELCVVSEEGEICKFRANIVLRVPMSF